MKDAELRLEAYRLAIGACGVRDPETIRQEAERIYMWLTGR